MVEHLPSRHGSLSSNTPTKKDAPAQTVPSKACAPVAPAPEDQSAEPSLSNRKPFSVERLFKLIIKPTAADHKDLESKGFICTDPESPLVVVFV